MLSNNTNIVRGKLKYTTQNEYNINRFGKLLNNLGVDYKIELQGKVYGITCSKVPIQEVIYEKKSILLCESAKQIDLKNNENVLKAFVRGCFLGGGSCNNPHHQYHFEIRVNEQEITQFVLEVLQAFGIHSKILSGKTGSSVYLKDAEEISKTIALMGASKAVLNFEEIRVVRDTRNNVNRLVNCETANLNKIINASVEQIKQIESLKKKGKFDKLPESLKEIANVRQAHPEASLVELGQMLTPPIGKSGVNHRLKKICEIARELRPPSRSSNDSPLK